MTDLIRIRLMGWTFSEEIHILRVKKIYDDDPYSISEDDFDIEYNILYNADDKVDFSACKIVKIDNFKFRDYKYVEVNEEELAMLILTYC